MAGEVSKGLFAVLLLGSVAAVWAQVAENSSDPTGTAIPYPLIHLVSSTDIAKRGATADLRAHDPFLLYQTGRDLVNRQFVAD